MSEAKRETLRHFAAAGALAFMLGGVVAAFTTSVAEARGAGLQPPSCSDRGCLLSKCHDASGYQCWEQPGQCTGQKCPVS